VADALCVQPVPQGHAREFKAALGQTTIQMIDAKPGTVKQF
jgi:hypothetical protein